MRRIHSVGKDYQKLFHGLENPKVPAELQGLILARIDGEARRASRIKLAIFIPLAFISSLATVVSFQYLARETAQSGLSEYLTILFSDGGTVLSYWKEFLISLAEQAPVFGMTLFLGAVLALMGSLNVAFKNAQPMFRRSQLV